MCGRFHHDKKRKIRYIKFDFNNRYNKDSRGLKTTRKKNEKFTNDEVAAFIDRYQQLKQHLGCLEHTSLYALTGNLTEIE